MTTLHVETLYPVAYHSIDHLYPRGTKNDTSDNMSFNLQLLQISPFARVLDLGCSGGTFVESIGGLGGFAVGIEGSDYSQFHNRASWERIKSRLFTADIGKPFMVMNGIHIQRFNVATAWEVLEHLSVDELMVLNSTLHTHLEAGALFIGSVNTGPDFFEGHEYHVTIKPFGWWKDWYFEKHGWTERTDLRDKFHPHWVRGPNTNGPLSIPFVMQKNS